MKKSNYNKLIENWKVVMFSVLGATTFWFFNALNKDYSALITYPLEFVFAEDSVIVIEPLPTAVKLDVSSGGWNLFKQTLWFSVDPIQIELDNPEEIRYLTRSTLYPTVAEHLKSLSINYLLTDTLKINVERKLSKGVKLKVDSANLPLAPNFRITSPISLFPDTALISGPESAINFMENEYYVSISETNINNDYERQVAVPLPFEEFMSATPSRVSLKFKVERFDNEKIRVPVEKVNFPPEGTYQLSDSMVSINYMVARSQRDEIKPSQFSVTLDYRLLQSDSSISPILIFYPESVIEVYMTTQRLYVKPNAKKAL